MARQLLSHKNTRKLAQQTGLDVIAVLVRGGTGHRKDLCLADGRIIHLFADESLVAADPSIRHRFVRHADGSISPK